MKMAIPKNIMEDGRVDVVMAQLPSDLSHGQTVFFQIIAKKQGTRLKDESQADDFLVGLYKFIESQDLGTYQGHPFGCMEAESYGDAFVVSIRPSHEADQVAILTWIKGAAK